MNRQMLTDRFVSSREAAPAGKRLDYHDATAPGLSLHVTDKGSRSFVLITRYPPNPKKPDPPRAIAFGRPSQGARMARSDR